MEPRSKKHKSSFVKRISRWFAKLSKVKKVALITIAVLLVTTTGASAWYYNRLTDMEGIFSDVTWPGDEDDTDSGLTIDEAFKDKIINIALLGFDSGKYGEKGRRTKEYDGVTYKYTGLVDTIMVAAINIETGDIDIVSIPRDSYVGIYNRRGGKEKVNAGNYWGFFYGVPGIDHPVDAGIKSQVETISIALGGVKIHYYATVDMDAVIEIVDIMGGVYLDVPQRTYHRYGRVIAEPGYQWFSGRRFLDYVRSRQAAGGDYQRANKQQQVMLQVFDQFKKANKLVNAPQVLTSVRDNVNTNLSLEQIMALALFGTQKVNTSAIETHILQGSMEWGRIPGSQKSNWYYLVDHKAQAQLVRDIWGIIITPTPADVLLPSLEDPSDLSDYPSDSDEYYPEDPFDPTNGEDIPPPDPGNEGDNDDDPGEGNPEDWGSSEP